MSGISDSIKRVAIVGGTHGNELTGIYLVKKFQQFPELLHRQSFECVAILANPQAIAANQRYIDRDLNRCFSDIDLANPDLTSYEDRRAKEIAAQLGPKHQPQVDVIIDLHTTTSNMGLSILPSSIHPFNLRLGAHLTALYPAVRVCCGLQCGQAAPMVRSLAPLGCTIEVGAIAQGVLNADLLAQTEMLVQAILDYIDALNQGKTLPVTPSLTLYQAISVVDFPRNSLGEIAAVIHPQLQFQDYQPLHYHQPMFLSMTGAAILYQEQTVVYPVFINEAAYYEKKIAMVLTERQVYTSY
jgi:succinylglutamate desuccinylase